MLLPKLITRETRQKSTRAILLLALLGVASACTTSKGPAYVNLPPAPLPVYQAGDAFFYQDDKGVALMRRVVAVDGDRVDWITEERYRFSTSRNVFLPSLRWDGKSSAGAMTNSLVQDQLWPLTRKNLAEFHASFKKHDKESGKETEYGENWRCKVNRPRRISVPAGAFDAYKVICRRYDEKNTKKVTRTHTWYYAPEVGHFIKRIKKYQSGRTKTIELVSFRRGAPSS